MRPGDTSMGGVDRVFPATTGGLVARFRAPTDDERRAAFAELCARYWKPVYTYLRSVWAKSNEEAKDLTQAFFAWLLDGDALSRYSAERGSLRTYLKVLLKRFAGHEDEASKRLKRGGGATVLRLGDDTPSLEELVPDPASVDPEKLFDDAWLLQVMNHAIGVVRERYESAGRGVQMRVFEAHDLVKTGTPASYEEIALRLDLKASMVRDYLAAVRADVRREIRAELARLTQDDRGLEEEWGALFGR